MHPGFGLIFPPCRAHLSRLYPALSSFPSSRWFLSNMVVVFISFTAERLMMYPCQLIPPPHALQRALIDILVVVLCKAPRPCRLTAHCPCHLFTPGSVEAEGKVRQVRMTDILWVYGMGKSSRAMPVYTSTDSHSISRVHVAVYRATRARVQRVRTTGMKSERGTKQPRVVPLLPGER